MANVKVKEESLVDIANAIRTKNGANTKYLPSQMGKAVLEIPDKYNEGYTTGYDEGYKQSKVDNVKEEQEKEVDLVENGTIEISPDKDKVLSKVVANVNVPSSDSFYDTFWDAFQQNGERRSYADGFAGIGWTDDSFQPKYDIKPNAWAASGLFRKSMITDLSQILQDCNVVLDTSECVSLNQMFCDVSLMVRVPPISLVSATMEASTSTMFYSAPKLETIDKIISSPQTVFYGNMFTTPSLKNVTFEGEIGNSISFPSCSKLTVESAKSTILHLINYSGTEKEFAKKITFHSSVWTLLDSEGSTAPHGGTWKDYVSTILKWNY